MLVRWFVLLVVCSWLASCASSAVPKPEVLKPRPEPEPAPVQAEPAQPAVVEKEPSAYERRWASACTQLTALGRCPAPFDRPGVFFDAKGKGEYSPPELCGVGEQTSDHAAQAALEPKRKALRACLRGTEHGAWVDVVSDGSR